MVLYRLLMVDSNTEDVCVLQVAVKFLKGLSLIEDLMVVKL